MRALLLLSLSFLLLLVVSGRDHRGLAAMQEAQHRDAVECMADRVAEGAPYWMALNLCGGLDPAALERDLP